MNADLTEEENSRKMMNEFVLQKEIIGTERKFGTIEMRDLLVKLKADLQNWQCDRKKVVGEAQEEYYYLTFFSVRHILAFYDYFTSDVQDDKNAKILQNSQLPSREVCLSISCDNNDSHVLNEIGKKLHAIVGKLSKTPCVLRVKGKLIIADIVDRGKLCVASCDDKLCDVHSTNGLNAETMKTIYHDLYNNVVCVSSDLSVQGKTEWIKQASFEKKKLLRSFFLISDGADFGSRVRQLRKCKLQPFESLHIIIISADNSNEINMFLFELLSLGFVSSNVDVVSFPQNRVFIEVSSTFQRKLLNSLPITGYLIKEHLSWDIGRLNISIELYSPIQIVCNYLDAYEMHELDGKDIVLHGQLKPIE
ncbi:32153_t:CDS:2 [Gigaspora margarita]|uniref:32153_t:CDS:1 n=1 Tax=Gigaspora margarita TaxID=4874 RepID=A0ABN7WIZ4_GIGMA|nr:32153_t:CDS:2 [Gigaspora margarita]